MRPLSSFFGRKVVTESGRSLGRCHDVRGDLSATALTVRGLVVGRRGLLERLGIGVPSTPGRVRTHDLVSWDAVVRIDGETIVVRDGTEVE